MSNVRDVSLLVESLLIEKPENPIRFIVELLQKKDAEKSDQKEGRPEVEPRID